MRAFGTNPSRPRCFLPILSGAALLLAPRASSSGESSLAIFYVRLPLLARKFKLRDFSDDLPLGVYREVAQRFGL